LVFLFEWKFQVLDRNFSSTPDILDSISVVLTVVVKISVFVHPPVGFQWHQRNANRYSIDFQNRSLSGHR
jgi:hypothetical protein